MSKSGKRLRADRQDWDPGQPLPLSEAVDRVKSFKDTKFDQSVDICIHLGIDAKQADQMVRGAVSLPNGIGKTKRVIVFCNTDKIDAAKEAGAVEAGGQDLVKKVEDGWMDFDVAIASPDMMKIVSKLGRTLGPKGLMPSPKSGTVTTNVVEAIKEYAAGKVEFRNDAGGNVHAIIGKKSFQANQLAENAQAFIGTIEKMKPSAAKGHYVKKITLSATMTPGVQVEI